MQKKCQKCGRIFEAKQEFFKECPECYKPSKQKEQIFSSELLLENYYDSNGNILKEVIIGKPEKIANIFARDKLTVNQLRDFHSIISNARNKAILKDINHARQILWECQKNIDYQLKRGVIPASFAQFMKHHLSIGEKDEKSLEGFYQHLDSIVCYFPKTKD